MFRKSKNSAFYFFLLFVLAIFSMSLYRSIYAVLSPKQLTVFLEQKLEKEVELYNLELADVDFHFFHRFFFRPTIEWTGLKAAYEKNCNFIKLDGPKLFVELDVSSILQKKIQINRIDGDHLDLTIIRNKECDKLSEVSGSAIDKEVRKTSSTENIEDLKVKAKNRNISYVKNLPAFTFQSLRLQTEKNNSRFYVFENLKIRQSDGYYNFESNLKFSPGTKLSFLPSLKLNGRFDENENIVLSTKIREADIMVHVEPLAERNYRTRLVVKDFPFRYLTKALLNTEIDSGLSTHWLDLSAYTVGHWDDFFNKRLPLQVSLLGLKGDSLNLIAKDFTYLLNEQESLGEVKIEVAKLDVKDAAKFFKSYYGDFDLPYRGRWQGELFYQKRNLVWQGEWQNFTWLVPAHRNLQLNYDRAKSNGSWQQDTFKEKLSSIFVAGKEIKGEHLLIVKKDEAPLSRVRLQGLSGGVFQTYRDSADLSLNLDNTKQEQLRLSWSDVKTNDVSIAKLSFDKTATSTNWTLDNIIFNQENSFLNAISALEPKLLDSKALLKAKRSKLLTSDGTQVLEWQIRSLKPALDLHLQRTSLSDWKVLRASPRAKDNSLSFQEDVFTFIQ